MVNPLTWLSRRRFPYEPLISIEISRSRLLHNLNEFRRLAPKNEKTGLGMVVPVLKANAYGHGFAEVASILRHERHIPFFVVDSYYEALALRSYGVRQQIVIIGYTRPVTILNSYLRNTVFTVTSLDTLEKLEAARHEILLHLKIDTGMRRQGVLPEELPRVAELLSENPLLVLKGACTHFSDADNVDPSFTDSQIKIWNKIAHQLKSEYASLEYLHVSATDGHRYTSLIEANVSRLGIGLYGLVDGGTFNPKLDLKPVLSMKTIITSVKKLDRNQSVGYGNTFRAEKNMKIATIPVGYFEGIDRRLSNLGSVGVGREEASCPLIGRVSMNISTIDVTHVPDAHVGTPVTVISNDSHQENSIIEMAKKCQTISYEMAVRIPAHLKRTVV